MVRNIIVFGATGNTGIKVCEELSSQNIKHTAFIRQGSENKVNTKMTEIVKGDVLSKEDVKDAIVSKPYTDVIVTLGSRSIKIANIRSNATKNIVDVLTENSIKSKLHVMSAHGIRESYEMA